VSGAEAATVTLGWDANSETDLAGYRVRYGTASGAYSTTIDVGNQTTATISVPDGFVYYFVVQAYNTTGQTSGDSNEVFTWVGVCPYSVSPTSASYSGSASAGSVGITTQPGCTWTATSNAAWLTVTSGASGSDSGTTGYSVAANPDATPRSGTHTIAGQTFTVTQGGTCSYTVSPTSRSVGAAATTGTVSVSTGSGCSWTATSNRTWLTVTSGASGASSGTVAYSVAAYTGTTSRTGTLTIGGRSFTLTQTAQTCSYSISPTTRVHAVGAGAGTVSLATTSGCAWTSASNASWLTVTSGTSGSGSATVGYSVAANTGAATRIGTLTIGGQTFTATQAGVANTAPVVDAGFDVIMRLNEPGMLRGSVTDDGQPTSSVAVAWSVISGPGTVTFETPSEAATVVRFSAPGSYYLRLTGGDGALSASDDVPVLVTERPATAAPTDIDANGFTDLFWQHDDGWLTAWLMQGAWAFGGLTVGLGRIPDSDWRAVGAGDLDLDGDLDFFWQHRTQGYVAAWIMNGTSLMSALRLTPETEPDLNWKVQSVADLDGDRYPDLVWQHQTTGRLRAWLMHGTVAGQDVPLVPDDPGSVDWQVVGAADFNGDGHQDLVWQHRTAGDLACWLMVGTVRIEGRVLGTGPVTDTNWRIEAIGDPNQDGAPDLVWHHLGNGGLSWWPMSGTAQLGAAQALSPDRLADLKWRIAAPR
jgi:hypothetical protein